MRVPFAAGTGLFVLASGASAGPAFAQQPPGQPPAPEPPAVPTTVAAASVPTKAPDASWYGWQMLIGFGASDASLLWSSVASQVGGEPFGFFAAGWVGHLITGPVTHWAHGHVGKGFASLGLTLGAGIVGAAAGVGLGAAANTTCNSGNCIPPGIVYGFFIGGGVGVVAINIVDVLILSREAPRGADHGSVSLVPLVTPQGGGLAAMGLF
jgi:hypothetical protein